MKGVAHLINRIYSIYAVILYFLCMILILLVTVLTAWLPERAHLRTLYRFNRMITFVWELLTGIRFRIKDFHKIDKHQTYVFTVNHLNILDILLTGTCILHDFKPLSKVEIFKIPIIGQIFSMVAIPVDRSNKRSRLMSLQAMISTLEKGTSLMIFPEGTRNRTPNPLKSFYDGAFRCAIKAQVPIAPVVSINTRKMQPVDTFKAYPGVATFLYLDPIPTVGLTKDDIPELRKKVHAAMSTAILENDSFFKNYQPEKATEKHS